MLALIVAAVMCVSCSDLQILFECPSPSGRYVATYYRVGGGGATGWMSYRVDIREAGDEFDPADPVFKVGRAYYGRLAWDGDNHLDIGYPSNAEKAVAESRYDGISIRVIEHPSDDRGRFADPALAGCGSG